MVRRIVIEMDSEEGPILNDILKMIAERVDSNVELSINQKIIPDKSKIEIQTPQFMNHRRIISQQEKEMIEALGKKEEEQNV